MFKQPTTQHKVLHENDFAFIILHSRKFIENLEKKHGTNENNTKKRKSTEIEGEQDDQSENDLDEILGLSSEEAEAEIE